MPETPATMDVSARWVDDEDLCSGFGTHHFLFPNEGDLLVREPRKPEPTPEAASTRDVVLAPNRTILSGLEAVPSIRAQRVRTGPDDRYILLKKYDGVVISRGPDSFTARLYETSDDYPVLEAEFDLEELSEGDRALAVEGAPLVWTIGYGYEGSTRKRESAIYMRRLPAIPDKEIERGTRAVEELMRGIRWE
jgi:hypothetical protein